MIFLLLSIVNSYEVDFYRVPQSCSTGLTGYFWNGQQCVKCKQPTCKCSTYNGCTSCLNSYYYDETDSTCSPCPLGCLKCCKSSSMTTFVCTLCENAYLMISGVCIYSNACTSLTIHGRCQSCMESYYLEQVCIACPVGCASCDSQYYCTTCQPGYFIDVVDDGLLCKSCNTETTFGCRDCSYALDDSGKVTLQCEICLSNYYYDEEKYTCTSCQDHCITCQNPAIQPQVCYICENNYLLSSDGQKCQNCQDQVNYCLKCNLSDDQTSWLCIECYNGFYLENNTCIDCYNETNYVRNCDSQTKITQCIPGYLLLQDESNNLRCVKDQYDCYTIDTNEQCFNCFTGSNLVFDLSLQRLVCKECTKSIENCLECDTTNNQIYCKTCTNGYYPNNPICAKCTDNCYECQTISTCKTCSSGYFLDSSQLCQSCSIDHCVTCSTVGKCTTCENNYGLINLTCEQCLTGCKKCDGNADQCIECAEKYYLVAEDKTCKRYKENCLKSNVNGYCYLCDTIIDFDPSTQVFPDEYSDESSPYYDVQPAIFYISNNGYCLICADYATGTYKCPQICTIEEQYSLQLTILILFYLI